jgi:hypothetical protein
VTTISKDDVSESPAIAFDGEGNAIAVWEHHTITPTSTVLQYAGFDGAPPDIQSVSAPAGVAGQPVSFSANVTDRWTTPTVTWTFGDGGTATGRSVIHTYATHGSYQVTITATDGVGNQSSSGTSVAIGDGAAPATYTVPGFGDAPGGMCDAQNACTTLRAAVTAADANPGSTIRLGTGTYAIGNAQDAPGTGQLLITAPMSIIGTGPGGSSGTTVAQTDHLSRVIEVSGPISGTVSLSGLEVTGGDPKPVPGPDALGGGILTNAALSLDDVLVSGNQARAADGGAGGSGGDGGTGAGGGIYDDGALLTITNSTVNNNEASGGAGGAGGAAGNAEGGGIAAGTMPSTGLSVTNSTITANTVTAGSTGAGGTAGSDYGGGVFSASGTITMVSDTLAGNTAAGPAGTGGNLWAGQAVTLRDVLIAGGVATGASGLHSNCALSGTLTDFGGNLEDSGSTPQCGLDASAHADKLVAPGAAGLQSLSGTAGSAPPTIALAAGSPAIDAGGTCAVTVDERGQPRGIPCDIGAFEGQPPKNVSPPSVGGAALIGSLATCSPGSWSGDGAFTYAYQWLRNGASIPGATKPGYKLTAADEGHELTCLVTATGTYGRGAATSAVFAVPHPGKLRIPKQTDTINPHYATLVTLACSRLGPCAGELQIHLFLRHGTALSPGAKGARQRLVADRNFTVRPGFNGAIKVYVSHPTLVLASSVPAGIPARVSVGSVQRTVTLKLATRRPRA